MDQSTLPDGFLTKQQVAKAHGCSERTVQRVISKLLKLGDQDALSHLRLMTDDGTVRTGGEVTIELIDKLNHDGLKPRWYIDPAWAEATYGQANEPPPTKQPPKTTQPTQPQQGSAPANDQSSDRELVDALRQQIAQLEKHNEQLSQQLSNRSDREKETNLLIRDLHNLMADMQHRLLPLRAESSRQDDTVLTVPDAPRASDAEEPAPHREATVVTTPAPTAAEQGTRKGRGRPKKAKPTPGKKRKSTRRAKARGKKAKTQQKEEAVRFFSTSMPTFKKYFHRARK